MTNIPELEVAIVGGGPSGVAVALHLQRRGITCQIFEKGVVGQTWASVPASLRLLNPWWVCALERRGWLRHAPAAVVEASEYLSYLRCLADRAGIQVNENFSVDQIRPAEAGYQLLSQGKQVSAKAVICATGYFANPRYPASWIDSDGSVPILHSSAIKDYAQLDVLRPEPGQSVLVVGRRISAGQLLIELNRRGFSSALSCRGAVSFSPERKSAWREHLYYLLEPWLNRWRPPVGDGSYPPMQGGSARVLVESGAVPVHQNLVSVKSGVAEFADGQRRRISGVLLATGFEPAIGCLENLNLPHDDDGLPLRSGFKVSDVEGLFLIGFDRIRSLRSRYLRGIRSDASRLARLVQKYLAASDESVS